MIHQSTPEQRDQIFRNRAKGVSHRIELLIQEGFSREEAIEVSKILELDAISDAIYNVISSN